MKKSENEISNEEVIDTQLEKAKKKIMSDKLDSKEEIQEDNSKHKVKEIGRASCRERV